jgi:hypothetical protein
MNHLTAVQNVVRNEAQLLCQQNEFDVDPQQVLLHVAVEILQQFPMNLMEIFAHNDARLVGLGRDDIDQVFINIMPKQFGIASEERHIYFVVNVAYLEEILLFVEGHTDFAFIFQFRGTVFFDRL